MQPSQQHPLAHKKHVDLIDLAFDDEGDDALINNLPTPNSQRSRLRNLADLRDFYGDDDRALQ